ncbi:C1 family peptidase [Niabella beijingensis]|uniref:C1 family peptidase n=1 Tax=Niabella beijingensis TaxID=2872700 RepID=UPI001CC18CF5|nr:C1 family peptidase [Niabella beijingensis]MBZ4191989.1 aminopeptidase [Niabella beijingensis]
MRKKYIFPLFFLLLACNHKSKEPAQPKLPESQYIFTPVKEMPALPVTEQGASGTCWSFSTASFLESEIMRLKGEQIKLSEMYFVRSAYLLKAQNYILRQGTARFTEGGLNHDPIISASFYGLLPESAYTGLINGQTQHNHFKLFKELEDSVKRYANPAGNPGVAWKQSVPQVLDKYLGPVPARFDYNGNTYTSQSFLAYTKLNPDDYITITSFSHVPFYKPFVLSIPANWANQELLNLPLDEFIDNINHAITSGYSVALDVDGTEPTFSAEQGVVSLPADTADNRRILTEFRPEKQVTQQLRQDAFENFQTTDDHLMHITGLVKDQQDHLYYKCKNSWGSQSGRKGYMYLSIPYMQMKAISVLLHKEGLADSTADRLSRYLR